MKYLGWFLMIMCLSCGCSVSRPHLAWSADTDSDSGHRIASLADFAQGLACEQHGQWQAAANCFERAALRAPNSPRVYLHWAWSLRVLGSHSAARGLLKQAERFATPGDYLLYYDAGIVYETMENYDEARRCYEKSLAIFPQFFKGTQALIALLHREMTKKK